MSSFAAGAAFGVAAIEREAGAARARGMGSGTSSGGAFFDITRHGAIGDGRALCTSAIQAALDAAAKAGGGTVFVPPGTFRTGALFLRSNIQLHLSAGATLLASDRFDDFPPIIARWEGVETEMHASLLTGRALENVVITGNGVLDGQGEPWWKAMEAVPSPIRMPRPRVINLVSCHGVVISGLMVHDSPAYNIHLVRCQDVIIDGVSILSIPRKAQTTNSDGIVLDSCKQVRVANCSLSTDSDNIALRAGTATGEKHPCEDVVVTNCQFSSSRWGGINLGRETGGVIRNVTVSNCLVNDCKFGVRLKTGRGRGGGIEQVRISNLVMQRVARGIECLPYIDIKEGDKLATVEPNEGTPTLRDLTFSGLTMSDVGEVARIEGLPERFFQGVRLEEVAASNIRSGVTSRRTSDLRVNGLYLDALEEHAVAAQEVQRLEVHRLSCARAEGTSPLVRLDRVTGAFVHGCDVAVSGSAFVYVEGNRNRGVTLAGNNLPSEARAGDGLRSRPG